MDKEFERRLAADKTVQRLEKKIRSGKGSMKDAGELGGAAGRVASKVVGDRMKKDFPNAQVSEEDVRKIISPILKQLHSYVCGLTSIVIDEMNKAAGIGLKAVQPEYNIARENELVREISARSFEDGFY